MLSISEKKSPGGRLYFDGQFPTEQVPISVLTVSGLGFPARQTIPDPDPLGTTVVIMPPAGTSGVSTRQELWTSNEPCRPKQSRKTRSTSPPEVLFGAEMRGSRSLTHKREIEARIPLGTVCIEKQRAAQ